MTQIAATAARDVGAGYSHYDKFVTPAEMLALPETTLKWYNVATEDEGVPAEIEKAARDHLLSDAGSGILSEFGELGFVILHRCGEDLYFLIANSWRNNNEIWETVYAKDGAEQIEFRCFQTGVHHRPTFCVWELAAVMYEKDAWRRFLLSERGTSDRLDYLNDTYEGTA
jgi:hypothetical protein